MVPTFSCHRLPPRLSGARFEVMPSMKAGKPSGDPGHPFPLPWEGRADYPGRLMQEAAQQVLRWEPAHVYQ